MSAPLLVLGGSLAQRLTFAAGVARGYSALDVFQVNELTADSARLIINFDGHARGPGRLVVVSLEGAGERPQHMLLKVLEESRARFILLASKLPLPTVVSRCEVRRLGAGPERDPTEAESAAAARVALALRAVWNRDSAALERALRAWDEDAHSALVAWSAQCSSGRFRPPQAMPAGTGFTPRAGAELLLALTAHGFSRPKLAAQAALADMASRGT